MDHATSLVPDRPDLDRFAEDFHAFHARFADLFGRSEPREQAAKYLRGLMGGAERRNGWQLAEAVGDALPDRTQRLLNRSDWSAVAARDRLHAFVAERFGAPDAIAIVDETGFLKKGDASVGVQRQYTGTAGKIENSQVGVFVGYASRAGHVLIDRALYVPKTWIQDPDRRRRAGVPDKVRFHTKPALALRMLRRAWKHGIPMAWVTGDEVYGNDPQFRAGLAQAGRRYVVAVAENAPVWPQRPAVQVPTTYAGRGRPRQRTRLAKEAPKATTVRALSESWPASDWHRQAVQEGEKGPIEYEWAARRVVESVDHLPGADLWLLARRSIANPREVAWYLSNADATTTRTTLAEVASTRYQIEQCFEEAKDDVGLDQYEVRTWLAWHRHITLSMMALAWLASVRRKLATSIPESASEAAEPSPGKARGPRRS